MGTLCIMKSRTHEIEAFGDYWINSAILREALFRTRSTGPTKFNKVFTLKQLNMENIFKMYLQRL